MATTTYCTEEIAVAVAYLVGVHPADEARILRAAAALNAGCRVQQTASGDWAVEGSQGYIYRVVRMLSCTCPDATRRGLTCKHQWLVQIAECCELARDWERYESRAKV